MKQDEYRAASDPAEICSDGSKAAGGFMNKLAPKFGNTKKSQYPEYKGDLVEGKACGKVSVLTIFHELSVPLGRAPLNSSHSESS